MSIAYEKARVTALRPWGISAHSSLVSKKEPDGWIAALPTIHNGLNRAPHRATGTCRPSGTAESLIQSRHAKRKNVTGDEFFSNEKNGGFEAAQGAMQRGEMCSLESIRLAVESANGFRPSRESKRPGTVSSPI